MSYIYYKNILDNQVDKNSINSAYTSHNIEQQNEKLACEFDFEEKQKEAIYIEKLNAQIDILKQNNKNLEKSNQQQKQLLELKEKELEENKISLIKSNKYNKKMFIMALLSTLTAVGSLVATILIAFLS